METSHRISSGVWGKAWPGRSMKVLVMFSIITGDWGTQVDAFVKTHQMLDFRLIGSQFVDDSLKKRTVNLY